MIVSTICPACLQTYQLHIGAEDAHLVSQLVDVQTDTCPCPRLCGGWISIKGMPADVDHLALRDPIILSGQDLYRAIHGMGLPDEVPKDLTVVEALLKAHAVKSIVAQELHGKVYLHELHLDNDVIVHLTSGARGAQVLKITRRPHAPAHPG